MYSNSAMQAFDHFTDPGRMKDILQHRLSPFCNERIIIKSCELGYTRYKTYRKPSSYIKSTLSICYHLKVTNPTTRVSGEQIVYARAYLDNRSKTAFANMKAFPTNSAGFEKPYQHLPDLDMIVWLFPNDPALSHLTECIDPAKVRRHLPYDRLPPGLDGPEDILEVKAEVVHYRPEIRCTTRYRLQWGAADSAQIITLFGKTFSDDQGKALFERSNALLRESERDADSFLIAQPLGYSEEINTIWQTGLYGNPLVDSINKTSVHSLLKTVANGLAVFHQSGLRSPVKITLVQHMLEIKKKIAKLVQAFPQLSEPLKSIEQQLEAGSTEFPPLPDTIIHADFTVQQLLVCGDKIACFDFDEFSMGDPTQDVANFIVDCYFRNFDRDLLPIVISRFLHAYQRKLAYDIPTNGLIWYIKLLLVTKAYRLYLQQKPRLEDEVMAILALAWDKIRLQRDLKYREAQ